MNNPALILYLEDNSRDAELVQDKLQQSGLSCDLRIARDRAQYEAALTQTRFDLILSDYSLPDYDGMAALALARERQPDIPFIIISGTIGDEAAVAAMRAGANDYLMKDKLARLGPAIKRELQEAQVRRGSKQAETYRKMSRELFQLLNEPGDVQTVIQHVIAALKKGSGCDAVGIRLQDGEDFPFFSQQGFSKDFLLTENTLMARGVDGGVCRDKDGNVSLECTCGLVISGKTDAASPLFTKGGSFWINNSLPLLELPAEKDPRHHPRNTCIHHGYASVALVPVRNKDTIVGLIHLNARRKDGFTLETIEIMEGIAAHIGSALMRKRAEAELLEAKALTEAIVENIPLMIFLKEATDLRFVTFNRAGEELLGNDRKEMIGKSDMDLFPPEQAAHFIANDREVLDGKMGLADIPEEPCLTAKNGERLLHTRKVCIRGRDGKPQYLLGISEDITEQKRTEREREQMLDQLLQSQKLESIGTLASGVAHEINNPIMGILGYAQLILDKLGPDSPVAAFATEIGRETERVAKIVRNLLMFARFEKQESSPARLCDIVENTLSLIRAIIKQDQIILEVDVPQALPMIQCRSQQIQQVITNLLTNARDALNGKYPQFNADKIVRISARMIKKAVNSELISTTSDQSAVCRGGSEVPRSYLRLTVEDHGLGIPEGLRERIFDPFFTTKPCDKGTGLGLSISHGIVKAHGGVLSVESKMGEWTRFHLDLPV